MPDDTILRLLLPNYFFGSNGQISSRKLSHIKAEFLQDGLPHCQTVHSHEISFSQPLGYESRMITRESSLPATEPIARGLFFS